MGGTHSIHRYQQRPSRASSRGIHRLTSTSSPTSRREEGSVLPVVELDHDENDEEGFDYSSCIYKTPPASAKFMRSLSTLTLERDASELGVDPDDNECAICFNAYLQGCTLVSLECGHNYHKECLAAWFSRQSTCPYCRYEFPTDHSHYEIGRRERMARRSLPTYSHNSAKNMSMNMFSSPSSSASTSSSHRPLLVHRLSLKQQRVQMEEIRRSVLDRLSFSCDPCPTSPNGATGRHAHHFSMPPMFAVGGP